MKVIKFGGTSVGTPERMKHIAGLIRDFKEDLIVVLSAVVGTTNSLVEVLGYFRNGDQNAALNHLRYLKSSYSVFLEEFYVSSEKSLMAGEIINRHFQEIERLISQPYLPQIEKVVVVQGELVSTKLFNLYLVEIDCPSQLLMAADFMQLDEHGEPDIPTISTKLNHILSQHSESSLFVTQGFICRNSNGGIDNLKRGGSDYSATLIGAALKCEEVQIWTDIDGMHNNDPRVVEKTKPISHLSFEEASELAYFGAKILHPHCIIPAQASDIPVRIKNTMNPNAHGTLINSKQSPEAVKAIAAKDGITAIKIKSSRMILAFGFLRKVFEVFEKYRTPIDMITTSEIAVSLSIDNPEHLEEIIEEIKPFGKVEVDRDQTIICIVGDLVAEHKGVGKVIFKALENIPVRMISYGGSRNNISILVDTRSKKEALICLNKELFEL